MEVELIFGFSTLDGWGQEESVSRESSSYLPVASAGIANNEIAMY